MSCSQRESPVLSSPMLASHRKKMKLLFEKMHTAWWSKPRIYTEMGFEMCGFLLGDGVPRTGCLVWWAFILFLYLLGIPMSLHLV